MRRYADQATGADDSANISNTQFILPDMNAVRFAQDGKIRPVIHNQQCAGFSRDLANLSGIVKQFTIVHRLLANLNNPNSASDRFCQHTLNVAGALIRTQQQINIATFKPLSRTDRGEYRLFDGIQLVPKLFKLLRGALLSRISHRNRQHLRVLFQRPRCFLDTFQTGFDNRQQVASDHLCRSRDLSANVSSCVPAVDQQLMVEIL